MIESGVIGTLLNAAGIVAGCIAGWVRQQPLSQRQELFIRSALGAFTVFYGIRLVWQSLNGPFVLILKQLLVVILALGVGKFIGGLLRLQKASNRLGQFARQRLSGVGESARPFADGFLVCAALFCAAPLGWLGAIQDGLTDYYGPLAVKAVMDGLAAMGFVRLFGVGVLVSVVPVFVFQAGISLASADIVLPWLLRHDLVDSVNATGGLLVFCVALIIFDIKKIRVADYLPSLALAPLLTWWWR